MAEKICNTDGGRSRSISQGVEEVAQDENKGSVRVVSGSGFRYVVPFPWRLHQMLEDIEKSGDEAIVSWLPDGYHFQVHNAQQFMEKIIPRFFKQKSYKSFQRQLHLYGFHRVLEGQNRGAYFHENFKRSNRKLSLNITRIKAPKRRRPNKNVPKVSGESAYNSKESSTSNNRSKYESSDQCSSSIEISSPSAVYSHSGSSPKNSTVTSVPCQLTPPQDHFRDTSVADTCEWLINAGVPFSAFDPIAININQNDSTVRSRNLDLIQCAEEIKSLFSSPNRSKDHGVQDPSTQLVEPSLNVSADYPDFQDSAWTPISTFGEMENFDGTWSLDI